MKRLFLLFSLLLLLPIVAFAQYPPTNDLSGTTARRVSLSSDFPAILVIDGAVSSGTFTITFNGQTTSAQAYNVSAATLQSALEGLSTVGTGNVTVALSSRTYTIRFLSSVLGLVSAGNLSWTPSLVGSSASALTPYQCTPSKGEITNVTVNGVQEVYVCTAINTWTKLARTKGVFATNDTVKVDSAGNFVSNGAGGSSNHNILSATHSDSTAGTVVRGDLITGQGGSPTWTRLAKGSSGNFLGGDGTDTGWKTLSGTTNQLTVSNSSGNLTLDIGANVLTNSSSHTLTNKTYDAEGTGNTLTVSSKIWLPAAGCNNATAGAFWDLPTSTPAAPACVTGTNTQKGVLDFADTSGGFSAQNTLALPADFTGSIDVTLYWTTTATTGNCKWSVSTAFTATNAAATDDPSFNTASTVTTAAPGTANRVQTSTITGVTATGAAASTLFHIKVFRDGNDGSDTISATARLIGVEVTFRRAI